MTLRNQRVGNRVTLTSVTTEKGAIAGDFSGESMLLPRPQAIIFELDVTAAATDAGDELDVYVQTLVDGTNWIDVVRFTQLLGNGGAKRFFAKITAAAAETMFEAGAALNAGNVRNLMGDAWRTKHVQVDDSTQNASFTFAVYAVPV